MPPYIRDIPASVTCAVNSAALAGKKSARTSAIADDTHECPDGYDGWLGAPMGSVIPVVACHGRMYQYSYFASQQPISASIPTAPTSANTCAAARSFMPFSSMNCPASSCQYPTGVYVPFG